MTAQETVLTMVIQGVIVVSVVFSCFAGLTLVERRLLARFQARRGPNRAGPFGTLQPLADIVKLVFKEDFVPEGANRRIFQLAPAVPVIAAVAALSLIPFGGVHEWFGQTVTLYGADLDVGVLVMFALSSLGFYGLILGGWASGNKYSLLGAARSAAQMVSYEVAMGLSIVGVVMVSQSLSLVDIVNDQSAHVWYIVYQPVAFVIFMIAAFAETNRTPFDLAEAESELIAGYNIEYSSVKFAMFQMGEYVSMIVVSAFAATLFLGGPDGPVLPGFVWLALKISALLFIFIWVRATLPRLRYDRLMAFGWKVLLPVATANILVTAIVVGLAFDN
ncbi:MAG: NADH-quinone oxidoreductase subunit NuoH [Thermoleophilia bacterium]|nr:NADH-quinone oxidoreductase subunit NuoH [Thermoleophilia bacterium]